jgi:hypothetical protein
MKFGQNIVSLLRSLRSNGAFFLGALALCCFVLIIVVSLRRHEAIVETVTTGTTRPTSATQSPSAYFVPQLPRRDIDVEVAGDHIASATMYLESRQGAAALRAMTQARAATAHAIARRKQQGKQYDRLQETLSEIDSAERIVKRGALSDARARLISLNRKLDGDLEP